eukprot:scaffold283_cov194-Alexandrium_tamarense.AAC.9
MAIASKNIFANTTSRSVRAESIDSFGSTIDVNNTKHKRDNSTTSSTGSTADDVSDTSYQFHLKKRTVSVVNNSNSLHFDLNLPPNHSLTEDEHHLCDALSSIVVLDSHSCKVQGLLDTYSAHLIDMGNHLLEGLRDCAPTQLAARVGDFNENLFYEMQDCEKDIGSIILDSGVVGGDVDRILLNKDVQEFESAIREALKHDKLDYRGSYLQTEQTMYQPAHVDYDYPILKQYGGKLFLAFFPLSKEGTFLQLWKATTKDDYDDSTTVEGTVVYVPYGKMLIVPSDTIHGGGFKRGCTGNLRFHLYIELLEDDNEAFQQGELLNHPMNRYTEEHDRRRELCERFVDANGLDRLLGVFFED